MKRITFYTTSSLLLFIILFSESSCKKSNQDDLIPNVPVNFTIYLTLPQYAALNNVGSYVTLYNNGSANQYGYRGVVVYRRALEEFVAFDLACPFDPTTTGAILEIDSSGITTVDRHCGSQFSLYDGSIIHGPATRSMKGYHAEYVASSSSVYIYN